VGKALFIQGFWGASEEVPVTRDMTVTRDATAEREKRCLYTRDMFVRKGCFGHTSNRLERLQFIPNRTDGIRQGWVASDLLFAS
jgi:hypothetical protein